MWNSPRALPVACDLATTPAPGAACIMGLEGGSRAATGATDRSLQGVVTARWLVQVYLDDNSTSAHPAWCRPDCGFSSGRGSTALIGMIVFILSYIVQIGAVANGLVETIEKVVVAMAEVDCEVLPVAVVAAVVCRAWTRLDERC